MATKDVSQQPSKARKQKRLVEMRKSKNVRNTEVDKQLWPSRSAAHFSAQTQELSSNSLLSKLTADSWQRTLLPHLPVLVISKIHLFQVHAMVFPCACFACLRSLHSVSETSKSPGSRICFWMVQVLDTKGVPEKARSAPFPLLARAVQMAFRTSHSDIDISKYCNIVDACWAGKFFPHRTADPPTNGSVRREASVDISMRGIWHFTLLHHDSLSRRALVMKVAEPAQNRHPVGQQGRASFFS